jgi:predicted RNase H-like HicB family nuclease
MKIELAKDKDGYRAKVAGWKHLTAFGYTPQEALEELSGVVEMDLESDADIQKITKKINEYLLKLD